jgi:AraC-like DNA-binding protein/transposase
MRHLPRPLLLLHRCDEFRNRVIRAGGARFACWSVADWPALREAVRDTPPTTVVVVDPYLEAENGEVAPQLDVLLRDFPWAGVVAAVKGRAMDAERLRALSERGISEIILVGLEDSELGIQRTLRQAQGRFLKELLQRALPAYISGRARVLLMAAAEATSAGGHAPDLARALSLSSKTLARWCESSHLPPARRLLAWIRVLLATRLLDDPERTVSGVARACGYTSDSALRRALLEFLGDGSTQLRQAGAFAHASRAFVKELLELREQGRARRRAGLRAAS